MPEKEIKELLKKYLEGRASPEEKQLVDEWYESLSSSEGEPSLDLDDNEVREAYWNAIYSDIKTQTKKTRRLWPRGLAIAASIAFILVVAFYGLPPVSEKHVGETMASGDAGNRFENLTDKVMYVTLPDSSVVELLPESRLTYDKDFNLAERKVVLTGEAFFKISHNREKPFYVFANEVVAQVLGTSFRVIAYADSENITVAVTTGKVSVYRQIAESEEEEKKVILTPNQQAIYTRSDHRITQSLVEKPKPVTGEKIGKVKFTGAPVSEVFEALEKMYHVDIEFDEEVVAGCSITTSITGKDMFERIDLVCEVIGATYRVDGTRIVISAPGCN